MMFTYSELLLENEKRISGQGTQGKLLGIDDDTWVGCLKRNCLVEMVKEALFQIKYKQSRKSMDKRKHGCMGIINFLLESRLGEKVNGHNIGKENWVLCLGNTWHVQHYIGSAPLTGSNNPSQHSEQCRSRECGVQIHLETSLQAGTFSN